MLKPHPWMSLALIAVAVLVGPWVQTAWGQAEGNQPRVALVTQSEGFVHDVVKDKGGGEEGESSVVVRTFERLARERRFEVVAIDDAATLTPERMRNFAAIAFYTTGDLPMSDEVLDALRAWVEAGGGLMGIHPATDTFKDNAKWYELMGGVFDGHPWSSRDTITLKVHDADHPITRPYAEEAKRTFREEIYQHKRFDPSKVRVLMSLDMEATAKKKPYHVPIAWVKEVGEGRVFYTSLGHREDVWESEAYRAHLAAGLDWLLGRVEADATPNPDVSRREDEAAKKAAGAAAGAAASAAVHPPCIREVIRAAPESEIQTQVAEQAPDRPRNPWVFRSVLDDRARMLTAALADDLWVAYDLQGSGLYEVWNGGVKFQGAVYDRRHGPQPETADDAKVLQRLEQQHPWDLLDAEGVPVEDADMDYRGYSLDSTRSVTLVYGLTAPGMEQPIQITETPERVDAEGGEGAALRRTFTFKNIPADHTVRLLLGHDGEGGRFAVTGTGELTTDERGTGTVAFLTQAGDGETTVVTSWGEAIKGSQH